MHSGIIHPELRNQDSKMRLFNPSTDPAMMPPAQGGDDLVVTKKELQAAGDRLRALRLVLGKPQKEMAKIIGVSSQAWSSYEKGEKKVAAWNLLDLCDETGVSLEWIFRARMDLMNGDLQRKLREQMATLPPLSGPGRPSKKKSKV